MSATPGSQWNAGLYDEKHSFVWKMASGVLDLLEAKSGEHILDLGCGTGHLTSQIAEKGANVVGIDRSPAMVQQAREKYPALQFEMMNATNLAFPQPFDAVFSNATLHWIKEPEKVIAGISTALKAGGRFVAEFGGKGNTAQLMVAIGRAWRKLGLAGPPPDPWYYPGIAEYSGLLEKHGLEVTYASLFDRPTPLEEGERGLRNWLQMFGSVLLDELPSEQSPVVLAAVEEEARPALFQNGTWILDYRRLRLVARKTPAKQQ